MPRLGVAPSALLGALLSLCMGGWSGAGAAEAQPVLRDKLSGQTFVWVQGGCFERGAAQAGIIDKYLGPMPPRADELPVQRVCVEGFWLAQTPMTQEAWHRVMSPQVVVTADAARRPQVKINASDVSAFAARHRESGGAWPLRLPTEAQWEWACRPQEAGMAGFEDLTVRSVQMQDWAVFRDPKREDPHTEPVAGKRASGLGLYDMLGNVWEMTADEYDAQAYAKAPVTSSVPPAVRQRVSLRGGSYRSEVTQVRCGARNWVHARERSDSVGVRWVADAPPPVGGVQ